jgi:dienelactone hydrolase
MNKLDRFVFSKIHPGTVLLIAGILAGLPRYAAAQQNDFQLLDRWLIWSDPGLMVVRHLTDQVIARLDERAAAIAQLRTREDWLQRREHVRSAMDRVIGTLPHRDSPLNPIVTGVVQKDGYRIEKIVYESLPRMYVTGCLLVPDGIQGRAPTILYTAGSGVRAFRGELYQQHILNLVTNGYIVFAIDPIGQGERIQYYDPETEKSKVNEFDHTAHQCFLIGTSYAKYYIRDAMRAVDYLQTRAEVDPNRIGMGGLSWGGWQCTIVTALDYRITAAASAAGCNVGVRRWFQSLGPTSAGQHYPGFVTAGLDHADFFELMAPRAFLRMSTTRDYKVIQGARETYAEYSRAFAALGASDKLDFTEDDAGHGYTPKNSEAAYSFYAKHLAHAGPIGFKAIKTLSDDDTRITSTGQIGTAFKDATIAFDFNRAEAMPLLERLEQSRKSVETHLGGVRNAAQRLASVEAPKREAAPVFLGRHRRSGHAVEMYALEGETGYVIPLLLYVPDGGGSRPAIIYVHPEGKAAAAKPDGDVERLVKKGYVVAVPDVAGTGEMKNKRGDYRALQYIALMIDRSLVGLQAGDVMRVRAFLQSQPEQHQISRIAAAGLGSLGAALMHAAALDSDLIGIVLVEPPLSYQSVVMNGLYQMDVSEMVAGALTAYDLPDLVACVAPRRIALVSPRDHLRKAASPPVLNGELTIARARYAAVGAESNFRVMPETRNLIATIDWVLE